MSACGAVQTGIFAKLNAVAGLAGRVFDDVPQGTAYPHVVIEIAADTERGTDDSTGESSLVRVHTWSVYHGFKEVQDFQALIFTALDRQEITVSGYQFISCDYVQDLRMLDPDGETRHGVSEYRVMTDPL